MSREELIQYTVEHIQKLPEEKIKEISDFAEFLLSKIEDKVLVEDIQKLAVRSKSYNFLEQEDELYTVNDLKERYH